MATRKLVERVTARVFCHGPGGGNPVTIFASQQKLSSACQEGLAKECEWESVMVATDESKMGFYMPSGDEVSFCAHAALGAASAVSKNESELFSFQPQMKGETQVVQFPAEGEEDGSMACLNMQASFEESPVSHSPSLQRLLREYLGVTSQHLSPNRSKPPPTFVNSSIARPKTLVYVNSLDGLSQAKQPKVVSEKDPVKRTSFASACGGIDESTGIYLYAFKDTEDDAWECRQFPRNSGYPEDPATGIAAAALAASLYETNIRLPLYKFYQGTTMGRPSLIQVVDLEMTGDSITFGLKGKVEIDDREMIEVED